MTLTWSAWVFPRVFLKKQRWFWFLPRGEMLMAVLQAEISQLSCSPITHSYSTHETSFLLKFFFIQAELIYNVSETSFQLIPIFWLPHAVLCTSQLCSQGSSRIIWIHFYCSLLFCGFFCFVPLFSQCTSIWLPFGRRWDPWPTDESPSFFAVFLCIPLSL